MDSAYISFNFTWISFNTNVVSDAVCDNAVKHNEEMNDSHIKSSEYAMTSLRISSSEGKRD